MNDYPGTRRDPGQQLFDLLIGKRHTAACPVHLLVDADVAVAQTMQTDIAARCGGGGQCRAFGVGVEQAAVFRRADRATCQRLICLLYVRITERNERVVALAAQNCGNTIFAQRRSAVAAPMKTAGAAAADGYLLEAGEGIVCSSRTITLASAVLTSIRPNPAPRLLQSAANPISPRSMRKY